MRRAKNANRAPTDKKSRPRPNPSDEWCGTHSGTPLMGTLQKGNDWRGSYNSIVYLAYVSHLSIRQVCIISHGMLSHEMRTIYRQHMSSRVSNRCDVMLDKQQQQQQHHKTNIRKYIQIYSNCSDPMLLMYGIQCVLPGSDKLTPVTATHTRTVAHNEHITYQWEYFGWKQKAAPEKATLKRHCLVARIRTPFKD